MKRSLPIFLSIVMVMGVFFSVLVLTGGENDVKVASAANAGTDANTYTVKKGDSLYLIAQRYNTTVSQLKRDNGLASDLILPGQKLIIPEDLVDQIKIVIKKSHQKLAIYRGDTKIKVYKAQFGEGGMGDKDIQGDRKTPEGTFYITEKSVLDPADKYLGSRWMRLSYPNIEDADRGLDQGIIDKATRDSIVWAINNKQTPPQRTALGGGIGIHGGDVPEFGGNWTWGCIGLTNKDVEEIYNYVSVGTPVVITR